MNIQKKKFNSHVGLSSVHLIVVVAIIAMNIDASQPWRGIIFVLAILSLTIWPVRFFINAFKKKSTE